MIFHFIKLQLKWKLDYINYRDKFDKILFFEIWSRFIIEIWCIIFFHVYVKIILTVFLREQGCLRYKASFLFYQVSAANTDLLVLPYSYLSDAFVPNKAQASPPENSDKYISRLYQIIDMGSGVETTDPKSYLRYNSILKK